MALITLLLLKGSCVLLLLLPLVDMIDHHEGTEGKSRRSNVHPSQTLGNQTGVTAGEPEMSGTVSINWNSLSPTLSFQMSTDSRITGSGGISSSSSSSSSAGTTRHHYPPSPASSAAAQTTFYETLGPLPSVSSTKHYHGGGGGGGSVSTTSQSFHFHGGLKDKQSSENGLSRAHRGGGVLHQRKGGGGGQQASFVEPPVSLASSTRVTGPYFESNKTIVHISARAGQTVMLDCAVVLLQGRTVSWLRRRKDSLNLLTLGNTTFNSDTRLGLRFRYPNNWRLAIESVSKGDEGEYQCQLSTHPIKALIYHLKVIAPAVVILDENGHTVTERHYKVDSSLHLTCRATHVDKFADKVVWLKGDRTLPGGDSRVKVKLTKNPTSGEVSAFLSVLSVRKGDSGNYTCRASSLASSTIAVHVLNGELPAAVQHESSANRRLTLPSGLEVIILMTMTMSSATLLLHFV